jgi:hypothetical protein
MTKNCLLFLLLIAPSVIKAQYTEIINSNRPGYSESPYSVGTGIYQIEGGYQYKTTNGFVQDETFKTHITNQVVRIGALSERLEFKLLFNQEYHKIKSPTLSLTSKSSSAYGFGLKYLLLNARVKNRDHEIRSWKKRTGFHWSMLVPSVGLDASVTFEANPSKSKNFTSKTIYEIYKKNSPIGAFVNPNGSFKFRVLLQNHINYKWVIVTNVGFENILFNNSFYLNIFNFAIATTYNINNQWSTFLESKNEFNKYQNDFDIRTGVAFLLNKNLQFDSSINISKATEIKNIGVSVGFSYRIDKHVDKLLKPKKIKDVKENDSIKKPNFTQRVSQSTKEGIIVAGLYTGMFLNNLWSDVSIFSQNLFLKKENHIPTRRKLKESNALNREDYVEKPKMDKLLEKETEEYINPTALEKRKQLKAKEKAKRAEEREKEKTLRAKEKETKRSLKAKEKSRITKEKETVKKKEKEEKAQKEIKKIEDKELELYLKAVKDGEKEEGKTQKEIKKIEDKELELYEKAVEDGRKAEEKENKRLQEVERKAQKELKEIEDKELELYEKALKDSRKEAKRKQEVEKKAQKKIKEIEDKELELYLKAVEDGEKEAKRKQKKETK